MLDLWEEGIAYARKGGSLSALPNVIDALRLNAADGQAFTLGFLEGSGATIAEGSRERMSEACARYRRGRRRA
jgi:hypothetical protein